MAAPLIAAGVGLAGSIIGALAPRQTQQFSKLTPEQQAAQGQFLKMAQDNMGGASSLMQALAMNPQNAFTLTQNQMQQNVIDPMLMQRERDVATARQGLGMGGEMSSLGARALESGIRADYSGRIGQAQMQMETARMASLEQMFNRQAQLAQSWGNLGTQSGQLGMQSAFDTVQQQNRGADLMSDIGGQLLGAGLGAISGSKYFKV